MKVFIETIRKKRKAYMAPKVMQVIATETNICSVSGEVHNIDPGGSFSKQNVIPEDSDANIWGD